MGNGNTLTPQQQKFIDNLLSGMNQTDAYEQAGYKANGRTATASASRLLSNENIRHEIRERLASNREVLNLLTGLALGVYQKALCDDGVDLDLKCKIAKDVFDRTGLKGEDILKLVGDEKAPILVRFEGLDE